MRIRNVLRRGLRRFIQSDDPSGLHPATVEKLRRMISFLEAMQHEDELRAVPHWKARQLAGDRRGN